MAIEDLEIKLLIGGGPVSPVVLPTGGAVHSVGMTMRQQYACAALTGLLANAGSACNARMFDATDVCQRAFAAADAMLIAEGGA